MREWQIGSTIFLRQEDSVLLGHVVGKHPSSLAHDGTFHWKYDVKWENGTLSYNHLGNMFCFAEEPLPMLHEPTPHVFTSGVKRSEQKRGYRLVPPYGIMRTAARFDYGATRYGEFNWQKCLSSEHAAAEFCRDAYNHMFEHMMYMAHGVDPEEDHLGAIGWAQTVLCHVEHVFQKKWTELRCQDDQTSSTTSKA